MTLAAPVPADPTGNPGSIWSWSPSKCRRGTLDASSGESPRSRSDETTWNTADGIRLLPPVPSAASTWSPSSNRVGDIIEATRSPGSEAWNPAG